MNVTVNSQQLAAELRLLNKVVPTKPAVAILNHALLRADEALGLYATDLEVGVTTSCSGRVDEPGTATVPVAKLLQMVEQLPDADVSLAVDRRQLLLSCGAYASRLQTLPVEDFPHPPEAGGSTHAIDAAGLRGLINKTRHAVSSEGSKYVLKGALLTLAGPVAAMVATDGKRLALATAGVVAGANVHVVVPMKTLDVLAGGTDEGDLALTVGDRHLFFILGERLLTSRKLEGTFPNYHKIVPTNNDKRVVAERHGMLAALKRVALAAEETNAVYFDIAAGSVELSARSAGIGSAREVVQVGYEGEPFKACLDGRYAIDFFESSAEPSVTMAFKGKEGSALLTAGVDHVGVIALMRNQ